MPARASAATPQTPLGATGLVEVCAPTAMSLTQYLASRPAEDRKDKVHDLNRRVGNRAVTAMLGRTAAVLARSPLSDQLAAARTAGRPKGEVFAVLRGRSGGTDPDAERLLREMYAAGTDDHWLAETLLQHGPEPLWPAEAIQERARRSREHRWGQGPGEMPEAGNIRAELPFPPESGASSAQPVVAYFFPGETGRRALIIGGVHGNEPQGARVVESLRASLQSRCAAGRPPRFSTILVPVLHARTHDPTLQERRQRYIPRDRTATPSAATEPTGIEPNRTFPAPGEDYRDARGRVAVGRPELVYAPPAGQRTPSRTGHEATEMIPETRALIALIERFRPERIASAHAHSIGPTAEGRRGNDPGVFVDPALERVPGGGLREQAGSRALGERMLAEGRRRARSLPPSVREGRMNPFLGNVGGEVTYDPNAPHPQGYSLGDWAPAPTAIRGGITTVTVEVPQYASGVPQDARQRVEDLHRDLLLEIFLGPDPAPAGPTAPQPRQTPFPAGVQRTTAGALARAITERSPRIVQRDPAQDIREATDSWGLNLNEERLAARLVGYCRGHNYGAALGVIERLASTASTDADDIVHAMFDGSADGGLRLTEANVANMGRDPAGRSLLVRMRTEIQSGWETRGEFDVRRTLTAVLEDGVERLSYNRRRVDAIRAGSASDLQALASLFAHDSIADGDGTPQSRLRVILAVTEHTIVPGLQTDISFGDTGFAGTQEPNGPGFRDPHPSSRNQVGHFLTAVGLRVAPAVVSRSIPLFGSIRQMVQAPGGMSDDEVALRLTIGHEKYPDPQGGVEVLLDIIATSFIERLRSGPPGETEEQRDDRIARAVAERLQRNIDEIIETFRRQFQATTDQDIANWNQALASMRASGRYDATTMEGPQSPLNNIQVGTGRGNSRQDLRLSLVGYRFGELVQQGAFPNRAAAAQWLRTNLGPQ